MSSAFEGRRECGEIVAKDVDQPELKVCRY
jgi:hypothetical protein